MTTRRFTRLMGAGWPLRQAGAALLVGQAVTRVRLASLVAGIVVAVGSLGVIALDASVHPGWRAALALCVPWLILYWVRSLALGQMSPLSTGAVPLTVIVIGASTSLSGVTMALVVLLLVAGLWFETLMSSGADILIRTAIYAASYLFIAAPVVATDEAVTWPTAIGPLVLLVSVALAARLVARRFQGDRRLVDRHQQLMRRVGAIASAGDGGRLLDAIQAAVGAMLDGDGQVRVALTDGAALRLMPITGQAPSADELAAAALAHVPATVTAALGAGQLLDASNSDQTGLHQALAIEPGAHVVIAPLVAGASVLGAVAVGSRSPLTPSQREDLTVVAALASLALQRGALTGAQATTDPRTPGIATGPADDDQLTGLSRRTDFLFALGRRLAGDDGQQGAVAVMHVDVDRFRVINECLGHVAGDQALVAVVNRLCGALAADVVMARIGGDEFALLLPSPADVWVAIRTASSLLEAMQEPIMVDGNSIVLSVSIGIALAEPGHDTADTLFQHAAIAMSEAKRLGRGGYAIYDATMAPSFAERLALETGLRRALKQGELVLYYQPILDLTTGRVTEVEALVRWLHPERGLLPPSEFVPMAEETGLIVPLGNWVLGEACRQVRAWQRRHPDQPPLVVGVNLSARQFQQPGLVAQVARALSTAHLDSRQLKLEVTESVALFDAESTRFTFNELRLLGVTLAMDDFGTGYSALRSLKRFPLHQLKIDRSFIGGLGADPGDTAIVRAVIDFAKSLGLRVTAEGVETVDQLRQLRSFGCDLGQGYIIAEPRPWSAMADLLVSQAVIDDSGRLTWQPLPARLGRIAS
jgi:diguanylate cyclase (GGDEF)-like protein